ncbi:MAG: ABC transporter ATP-binding protein [Betaproteobacteria bacterium]|nr:ABC transporter ATP-binding protein [Betaproteobacteria bacterium]
MKTVLQVSGLGKAYRKYPHRWAQISGWFFVGDTPRYTLSWVLRDINFRVKAGEAVGVIGQNGAGKSTLLKLITGTTKPTAGQIAIDGRVSALLELGMGFHPDFTGRQNVYMAGQVLGYRPHEISSHMSGIEAFAEIGTYIDEPVRTYSSGMQVRLAFSVSTMLRPEILIVDEALSVGDVYFQHKCFARIREFKALGTTLLFVSHDPGAVKTLCDRALLLDAGLLVKDDRPDSVLNLYNAIIARRESEYQIQEVKSEGFPEIATRSGNSKARVVSAELLADGEPVKVVRTGTRVVIRITAIIKSSLDELTAGFLIRDRIGNDIFGTSTHHLKVAAPALDVGVTIRFDFEIKAMKLGVGNYSIAVALHRDATHVSDNYDWVDHAVVFQVISGDGPFSIGSSVLDTECSCVNVGATDARI